MTTAEQQAEAEARAKWKKKKDKGYQEDIKNVDVVTFIEPMLAHKYVDRKEEIDLILEGGGFVFCQPKLDGIRCVVTKNGMFSRNGKPILSAPHIHKALLPIFADCPDAIFDGELYCDKFKHDFNKICSLVKKTKPTPEDCAESAKVIEYWIYDTLYQKEKPFSLRFNWLSKVLQDLMTEKIKLVKTQIIRSKHALDVMYGQYLESGVEGQMIRVDAEYEQKRSKYLLKRKEFQDSEFKIIDIEEGSGNKQGIAASALLVDKSGKVFNANIKGCFDYCKELLERRREVLGKMGTVQYQNLTPDGVPRFGYLIAIRDYE
jgi:DNA ligase 1